MQKGQIWAVTLMLTLAGMGVVIAVALLVIAYLTPVVGSSAYVAVFGVAAVVSVLIGRAVRWLLDG